MPLSRVSSFGLTALLILATLPTGCAKDGPPKVPVLDGDPVQIVPRAGLPGVPANLANNNLDIVQHDGRLFFAWRTAPSHFASADAYLNVLSREPGGEWEFEATLHVGTDLREPRFLSWNDSLFLYFAVLGDNPSEFVPGAARWVERVGLGEWTEDAPFQQEGFIPWRTKVIDDVPYMTGYVGGENIYDLGSDEPPDPVQVQFLTTTDGVTWTGVVPNNAVVHVGGGSETDFALLDDGTLIAVMRNELGDDSGFGSKICRAEADRLGIWSCIHDPRKYDSPLVFSFEERVFLIARRNVTETGWYDLGRSDLDAREQYFEYQTDYWGNPKRCSLWEVDSETLEVSLHFDLPSAGDTCFAGIVPYGDEDAFLIYNYSSPIDGDPDISWLQGQTNPTNIYSHLLRFEEAE